MNDKRLVVLTLYLATLILIGIIAGIIILLSQPPGIVVLVPNQGQMQMILNRIEPNSPLQVDYHIGTDSRGKWNRIVNNAYAKPHFEEKE